HFVWQQQYEMGDDLVDSQHKNLFDLADKLVASRTKEELLQNIEPLYQHVKDHFNAEEALMKKTNYRGFQGHEKEHNRMLKKLIEMDNKISNDNWNQSEVLDFVEKWGKHISHSDMSFNNYMKQQQALYI
ncbi:MAG: hemerythrin family protein, partial [Methylococcales bacterium]|nr:hemerythrin family protein [Methylococcales bacterium]